MMKQTFIFLFFLLTLLGSCSNHRMEMSRLAYIDSLMEVNAQIAYDSLSQDSGVFLATGDRRLEMKYRLLMAKAQNKLFFKTSNPQPIGFSGILLAKRQNSFYCTYSLGITETS